MPRYAITEKAGRFVAANRNTGVGTVLELTEKQAEHELRLGSLVALDTSPELSDPSTAMPADASSQEEPSAAAGPAAEATRKGRRGKP